MRRWWLEHDQNVFSWLDGRKILRLLAWFVSTRSCGWLGGRSARTSNLLSGGWDENQKAWHRHITAHGSGGAGLAGHRGGAASDAPDVLSAPANFCSLLLPQASIESQGYVDRIYCHHDTSKGVAQLLRVGRGLDPSQPEEVSEYDLYQTAAFSNTVVFNPWKDGKRGPAHPDFDDDGYKARQKFESSLCLADWMVAAGPQYMVCVEPAVAKPSKPVELAEGEIWSGECLISIK